MLANLGTSCRLGTSLDSLEDVVLVIDLANASQSKLEVKIYDQMGNVRFHQHKALLI